MKSTEELARSDAVGYLKFTSNTDVVFTQNDETRLVLAGASPVITDYPDMPVYIAPPNYKALQAENKELVEYIARLRSALRHESLVEGFKLIDAIPLPESLNG